MNRTATLSTNNQQMRLFIPLLVFLFLIASLPLAGLALVEPAVSQAGLTLARLVWRLTPLFVWPTAVLIVAVWLWTLRRMWRRPDKMKAARA
jgi:hypothetical protein